MNGASAYPSYKDSGNEWLGDIPAHWDVKRGAAILVEKRKKNDPLVSENYLSLMANRGIIPYAEKGDIGNKKPDDLTKCKLVARGDFVINSMNYSIGSYGVSKYDGICSSVYVVMSHNPQVVAPEYVDLILSNPSYQKYAQSFGTGILDHRRAIGWDEIKKIPVAIPPIREQVEIAGYVRERTSRIDSLIEKKSRFIELLKEKRSAFITSATSRGLNIDAELRGSGSVWLGDVPLHWRVVPLKAVADVELSNIDKKSIDGEPDVFLCNYVDVYKNEKITRDITFMRATASPQQIQRLKLQIGDVLLTKDSESPDDIGVPSLVADEVSAVCGYHLAMARPRKKLLAGGYLAWFLRSHHAKVYFENEAKGMTRYGIDKSSLKDTPIGLPPLSEQVAIADQIDRETARIDGILLKTKITIDLLKERRAALITAAVTGKIDVRNSK